MATSLQIKNTGLLSPVAFGAGLFLLALSPIIRGGNRYVALIGLEWLGLFTLWLVALSWLLSAKAAALHTSILPLRYGEWALVLSPLCAAFLYLTPVPIALWGAIPGRAIYLHALEPGWRPISLTPDATVASLLAGIPVVAVFVIARISSPRQFDLLPPALVLIAFVQAIWGLLQAGPFKELYFGAEFAGGLIGSFANANHFANFIAMTLPLAVFVIWQALPERHSKTGQTLQVVAIFWSLVLLILVTAVVASGSRTGLATGLMVTLLALLLLLRSLSEKSARWFGLGAGVLLLVVLVIVGADRFVARFDTGLLGIDASFRWLLIGSSWQAAQAFWPVGSGPGSYSAVYPLFQPPGLRGFAEHAHNDYVQLLMEFGALFVLLAGLVTWLVVRQGMSLWRHSGKAGRGLGAAQLQLCCGLGLLAVLLHSWVDFNLHIPANAMLCACLLGAFLRPRRPGS